MVSENLISKNITKNKPNQKKAEQTYTVLLMILTLQYIMNEYIIHFW